MNDILLIPSSYCVGVIAVTLVVFEWNNNMVGIFAVNALLWWVSRCENESHTGNDRGLQEQG